MTHLRNRIRQASAILLLALFATAALAAPPVHFWNDPVAACDHDRTLDRTLRNLDRDDFELQSTEESPVMYLVPPTGDHVWGTVVFTLTRRAGDMSLETDYAVIRAEVSYYDDLGYKVSRITTEEFTVY